MLSFHVSPTRDQAQVVRCLWSLLHFLDIYWELGFCVILCRMLREAFSLAGIQPQLRFRSCNGKGRKEKSDNQMDCSQVVLE